MKVELFPFQKLALQRLRMNTASALGNYRNTHIPQIVSYTAPTGAGKTIIMSALIEAIFYGDEYYPDQSEAIFVWLSDSPQLNEQSRNKIDLKADKILLSQCVTITDDSFDQEILDDGHIYFLNTQKLSTASNLTKHSDSRTYTIWETLANTVNEKSDRLYFIIDEAHRGAQKPKALAEATTIMQKFLKGSSTDKLPPMPVIIGMTATSARFNRLAEGIQSTTHYVQTTPDEVRASGLLKDRIIIKYPENSGNDMAILQAASDEWKDKWIHWDQYCYEQHYTQVYPILLIQVQNGTTNKISITDLDECVRVIEERTGERFSEGQIVHAFSDSTSELTMNGLKVPYVEPSEISDNRRIKVVFFKEALSTGWDCPRAETMMSFRRANDHTYIAQLLGRMVRTPLQQHVNVDDTLNDVHLFLPQFNEITVKEVIEALISAEGANIPTDIEAEEIGEDSFETLSLRPTHSIPPRQPKPRDYDPRHLDWFNINNESSDYIPIEQNSDGLAWEQQNNITTRENEISQTAHLPTSTETSSNENIEDATNADVIPEDEFDRELIVKAINDAGLLTYDVRKVRVSDYLKSMFKLARFFTQTKIDLNAHKSIISDIVDMIHNHTKKLKDDGSYNELAEKVMQFKLNAQIFDVYGRNLDDYEAQNLLSTTDTDIDRQFRLAENKLGNEGVAFEYGRRYLDEYNPYEYKIDVILFASDNDCMDELNSYSKDLFHSLNDVHRRSTVSLPERFKKKYDNIVSDGDIVSKHNFRLPETIRVPRETEGKVYSNHLFVDDSGTAMIHLNGWESTVIEEEEKRDDFICWLRNPSRGAWALRLPYELNGEIRPTYPDFLIIRKDNDDFVVDILEPHDSTRIDNLGKAKGFAEYARQNPGVGRIQLIKMKRDSLGNDRPFRLDMSKSAVRDKVSHCMSNEELKNIFESDGFFD